MKFPQKVYVYWDDDYLITYTKVEDTSEPGNPRLVGVYELQEVVKVETETKVTVSPETAKLPRKARRAK